MTILGRLREGLMTRFLDWASLPDDDREDGDYLAVTRQVVDAKGQEKRVVEVPLDYAM